MFEQSCAPLLHYTCCPIPLFEILTHLSLAVMSHRRGLLRCTLGHGNLRVEGNMICGVKLRGEGGGEFEDGWLTNVEG